MTKPIFTYFDFPGGRGEAARLAFHIARVRPSRLVCLLVRPFSVEHSFDPFV